jgi:hypothetical protein
MDFHELHHEHTTVITGVFREHKKRSAKKKQICKKMPAQTRKEEDMHLLFCFGTAGYLV